MGRGIKAGDQSRWLDHVRARLVEDGLAGLSHLALAATHMRSWSMPFGSPLCSDICHSWIQSKLTGLNSEGSD